MSIHLELIADAPADLANVSALYGNRDAKVELTGEGDLYVSIDLRSKKFDDRPVAEAMAELSTLAKAAVAAANQVDMTDTESVLAWAKAVEAVSTRQARLLGLLHGEDAPEADATTVFGDHDSDGLVADGTPVRGVNPDDPRLAPDPSVGVPDTVDGEPHVPAEPETPEPEPEPTPASRPVDVPVSLKDQDGPERPRDGTCQAAILEAVERFPDNTWSITDIVTAVTADGFTEGTVKVSISPLVAAGWLYRPQPGKHRLRGH